MNFAEKRLSNSKAINILASDGINVNEEEVNCILELMYLMSRNFKTHEDEKEQTVRRYRTTMRKDK